MQNKRMIIGFSGKRGVGKTLSSMHLSKKHGFKIVSFAAELKNMAKTFFPFTPLDFSEKGKERPYKDHDWTPRDFAISLGKFARFFDEDYWVKKAGLDTAEGNIAIDDVRFPNEVEYIRGLGGKVVRLERFESLNIYGKNLDDPSETSLDKYHLFDYTIDPCWNVEMADLHKRLDIMMKQFKESDDAAKG